MILACLSSHASKRQFSRELLKEQDGRIERETDRKAMSTIGQTWTLKDPKMQMQGEKENDGPQAIENDPTTGQTTGQLK